MADIRVRVGQQNAVKVISSVGGAPVGFSGYANYSGISSYSNYSGISSYSNYSGISTYAYNIYGGSANRLVYQTAPGVTSFVSAGNFGQILYTNIDGVPVWINSPPLDAITGLTVINQSQIVGNANSITTLRIVGFGLSASLGNTPSVANLEIIEIDGGEY